MQSYMHVYHTYIHTSTQTEKFKKKSGSFLTETLLQKHTFTELILTKHIYTHEIHSLIWIHTST